MEENKRRKRIGEGVVGRGRECDFYMWKPGEISLIRNIQEIREQPECIAGGRGICRERTARAKALELNCTWWALGTVRAGPHGWSRVREGERGRR